MALSSSLSTRLPLPLKPPPQLPFAGPSSISRATAFHFRVNANLGGGGGEAESKKESGKKKFITKEQEPEQYWQTAGEREGENPMMTPLPYIIIFALTVADLTESDRRSQQGYHVYPQRRLREALLVSNLVDLRPRLHFVTAISSPNPSFVNRRSRQVRSRRRHRQQRYQASPQSRLPEALSVSDLPHLVLLLVLLLHQSEFDSVFQQCFDPKQMIMQMSSPLICESAAWRELKEHLEDIIKTHDS